MCAHAFCIGYRTVCTRLALNLEVNSAAEISSGPRSAPWVSPLASATGVISKVFFCIALFIYVLARLPQYLYSVTVNERVFERTKLRGDITHPLLSSQF